MVSFICILSSIPVIGPESNRVGIIISAYRCDHCDSEKLSDLLLVTEQLNQSSFTHFLFLPSYAGTYTSS